MSNVTWKVWNGAEKENHPLPYEDNMFHFTQVEAMLRDGRIVINRVSDLDWRHQEGSDPSDIVGYRILSDSISLNQVKDETPNDPVNHPSHYGGDETYEVIKVLHAWQRMFGLGFDLLTAIKYIPRAGKKDPAKEIEDLEKSQWYINERIRELKGERIEDRKA